MMIREGVRAKLKTRGVFRVLDLGGGVRVFFFNVRMYHNDIENQQVLKHRYLSNKNLYKRIYKEKTGVSVASAEK